MSPVPLGPFSVEPQQISRLGGSFASFVEYLLQAEAAAAELKGVQLVTNYRENAADGGVDSALYRASGTDWIPEGDSVWQFKAGDLPPEKCKEELRTAMWARTRIRDGAKYRLVLGAGLTGDTIASRKTALKEQAKSLRLPYGGDRFEVIDATMLARWASAFPSLAVSRLVGGPGTAAKDYAAWTTSNRHQTTWVIVENRVEIIETLARLLKDESTTDVRINGQSGVGKSRLVLEALRDPELSPLVAFIPEESDLGSEYINHLFSQGRSVILVVDNCSERKHETFAEQLEVGRPIRLVTIGIPGPESYLLPAPTLSLDPLEGPAMELLIQANFEGLWPEARRLIVDLADGNPRFAIFLARQLSSTDPADIADLVASGDIRRFLRDSLPEGSDFLASSLLALFERIGWDRDRRYQMEALAEFGGLEPSVFEATAANLEQTELLTRQGRYRSVAPFPLATYLAAEGWRQFGPRISAELIPMLDSEMALALFRRAADLGRYGPAQETLRHLLSSDGPFASLDEIEAGGQGRHLTQLAIVMPEEATRLLTRVILMSSTDELRAATACRRDLVWTLEKLAWHKATFRDAADLLLRLALSENETYANNATGTWLNLFGTMLPGTSATPDQRQIYLSERTADQDPDVRRLTVDACAQGLSPGHESIAVSAELQGGSLVETRGTPSTLGEVADYRKSSIALLRTLAMDVVEEVATAASTVLVKSIHPVLADGLVADALMEAVLGLPTDRIQEVRNEVQSILALYDRVGVTDNRRLLLDRLNELNNSLPDLDAIEEIYQMLVNPGWEDRGEQLGDRVADRMRQVAATEDVRQSAYNWLSSNELGGAWELGYALYASGIQDDGTISALVSRYEVNSPALAGFLAAEVRYGVVDAFDRFIDSPAGVEMGDVARLLLTVRGPATSRASERIRDLLQNLPVFQGARGLFGWQRNLSDADLVWILREWIPRVASEHDYIAVIDWFGMASFQRGEWPSDLTDLVLDLVLLRRHFVEVGQEQWEWARLAERYSSSHPVEIANLLIDLVASDLVVIAADEEPRLLTEVARQMPEEVWAMVGDRLDSEWRLVMGLRGWFTPSIPEWVIRTWVNGSVDKAKLVAAVAGVGSTELSPIARYLLTEFGDDDEIRSSLFGEYFSGSWTGPQSNVLAQKIEQLRRWKSEPQVSLGVRRWVDEAIEYLEQRRNEVLEWEAEQRW